jgi:hypothetical protein
VQLKTKTERTALSSSQATGDLYKYWSGPRSGETGWTRILLPCERKLHPTYRYCGPLTSRKRYVVSYLLILCTFRRKGLWRKHFFLFLGDPPLVSGKACMASFGLHNTYLYWIIFSYIFLQYNSTLLGRHEARVLRNTSGSHSKPTWPRPTEVRTCCKNT